MGLIFYLSDQPGAVSQNTSDNFSGFIYDILNILFKLKIKELDFVKDYIFLIRKLAHFTEFSILGVLAYISINDFSLKKSLMLSIVFSIFYAISDEIHQLFVINRSCSIYDMLLDSLGAITGIIMINLISKNAKKGSID